MQNIDNTGLIFFKNFLSFYKQKEILEEVTNLLNETEPFINKTINGAPYKVMNANAGEYGWYSDEGGYHYTKKHPITGNFWPKIPNKILETVKELTDSAGYKDFKPESCYINFYLNQDSKLC